MFDFMKIPFLNCLMSISLLIVKVLNDQNLFIDESNLANCFSSYVIQFCSSGHFSE